MAITYADDEYIIIKPRITDAFFSANPANINQAVVLSVFVTEEELTLVPTYYYSGEVYSGEVD